MEWASIPIYFPLAVRDLYSHSIVWLEDETGKKEGKKNQKERKEKGGGERGK